MGNRRISDDLKEAALRLQDDGHSTAYVKRITGGISKSTLSRARKRKHTTGSVAKAQAIGRGRPRSLLKTDADYLLRLARHKPTLFLDEYTRRLELYRYLPVSLATIHRTFERAGLHVKRVQKLASERDPILRADFVRRIGRYPTEYLVSLDEVSKDERTYGRLWGRAAAGLRAEQHNPFVRGRRLSMVAGLVLGEGIIAARIVEGSFTRETFMEYLRDDVLPLTTPYPGPRSVLIMDNARIHHSPEIEDLVRGYGCRIEYLPPYSPDYNPIEQAFSVIKSHLRRIGIAFYPQHLLYYEMYKACELVTPEKTYGMFEHSGYAI